MGNLFATSSDEDQQGVFSARKRQKTDDASVFQPARLCSRCDKPIDGAFTKAFGKTFHSDCFQCVKCQRPIRTAQFFSVDGKAYCEQDYNRYVNPDIPICAVCRERVTDDQKGFESSTNVYHAQCFRCSACGASFKVAQEFFSRSNKAGTKKEGLELFCEQCRPTVTVKRVTSESSFSSSSSSSDSKSSNDSEEPSADDDEKASKVHKKEAENMRSSSTTSRKTRSIISGSPSLPKNCSACHKAISGPVMAALNQSFHPECFVCAKCKRPFLHAKFFFDHNTQQPYCRADFPYKLFPEEDVRSIERGNSVRTRAKRKR